MADVVLSAELQARVDSFVANLLAGANAADNTSNSVASMASNISRNVANVNRVNLSQFTAAMNAGTLSVQRLGASVPAIVRPLTTGSNQAAMALTNLGRVAQDAPFGFIGIQNNLNPLLESFQRLKTETGSNALAFKALASSLMGVGGIGLALSVVSSLYLVYTQYSQRAAKADAEKAKNTRSAKEALDDYIKSLDASTRAQIRGLENSQKDLINLNHLYEASRNLKIPMDERIKAAKALQDQYPKTFANFSAEQIALGKASAAYKQLSVDIIAVAKAAARTDILVENEKEIVQLSQKQKGLEKQLKTQKEIDERSKSAAKNATNISGSTLGGTTDFSKDLSRAAEQQSKSKNLQDQINATTKQIASKRHESLGIEKEITSELVKQQSVVSVTGIDTSKDTAAKKTKTLSEIIAELSIELKQNDLAFGDTFNEKRIADIDSYQKAINDLVKIGFAPASAAVSGLISKQEELSKLVRGSNLGGLSTDATSLLGISSKEFTIQPKLKIQPVVTGFSELQKEADAFNEKFASTIEKGFGSTLSTIGDSIGAALANGGDVINAIGTSILSGFGNFLSQFGDLLIEYGAAAILKGKLDLAIAVPGAGIAAGFAAVAAGLALKIAAGAIGSFVGGQKGGGKSGVTAFANGGIISGPTLGLMGEYAGAKSDPEVVAPLSKLKNLLGETDDAGNVIARSSNEPIVMVAESVIRGQDIVTSYRKASGTRNRQG
jgi:hypothetical protein